MDIKSLGAKAATTTKQGTASKVGLESSSRSGSEKAHNDAAQAFFENSGKLGKVRALIDELVKIPDFQPAAVERGAALLESGALDTPEAIDRAVDGFFEEHA